MPTKDRYVRKLRNAQKSRNRKRKRDENGQYNSETSQITTQPASNPFDNPALSNSSLAEGFVAEQQTQPLPASLSTTDSSSFEPIATAATAFSDELDRLYNNLKTSPIGNKD